MATPTIAIALGAGGARGIAHIHALKALDELGIKPVAISGTSIATRSGYGFLLVIGTQNKLTRPSFPM